MRASLLILGGLATAPLLACTDAPPDDPAVTVNVPTSYYVTAGGGPTASATQAVTVWIGAPPAMGLASSAAASVLAGPVCAP